VALKKNPADFNFHIHVCLLSWVCVHYSWQQACLG